jgi:hypothetical protein
MDSRFKGAILIFNTDPFPKEERLQKKQDFNHHIPRNQVQILRPFPLL